MATLESDQSASSQGVRLKPCFFYFFIFFWYFLRIFFEKLIFFEKSTYFGKIITKNDRV